MGLMFPDVEAISPSSSHLAPPMVRSTFYFEAISIKNDSYHLGAGGKNNRNVNIKVIAKNKVR